MLCIEKNLDVSTFFRVYHVLVNLPHRILDIQILNLL